MLLTVGSPSPNCLFKTNQPFAGLGWIGFRSYKSQNHAIRTISRSVIIGLAENLLGKPCQSLASKVHRSVVRVELHVLL